MSHGRGWQTFSVKNNTVNIFDFTGHMASVETIQLCSCSMVADIENTKRMDTAVFQ